MKQVLIILSVIILGEKALGMDIDVYLQPLVKALLHLWDGVDAYHAYSKTNFKLHGVLHSTTSDFTVYANLSGWSTKGQFACPSCARDTHLMWLDNGRKFCYRSIGDGFLKIIHFILTMLDLMETLNLVMLLDLTVAVMF